jgi:fumarylacetoacetase
MEACNATLNPSLRSWVTTANLSGSDFPIQNLPFGRFRKNSTEPWRIGVAIGDMVLDLKAAELINHSDMWLAFPRFSRQIMMSKLKRSHANGTNQICRRVQVRGGQASYR